MANVNASQVLADSFVIPVHTNLLRWRNMGVRWFVSHVRNHLFRTYGGQELASENLLRWNVRKTLKEKRFEAASLILDGGRQTLLNACIWNATAFPGPNTATEQWNTNELKTAQNLYDLTNSLDELYGADILLISKLLVKILQFEKKQIGFNLSHKQERDFIKQILNIASRIMEEENQISLNKVQHLDPLL